MSETPYTRLTTLVDELVEQLGLDPTQAFLGGSAALAIRNIRHIGDLDVGVTTRHWMELLESGGWGTWTTNPYGSRRCDPPYLTRTVRGTEVHVFSQWRVWADDETEYNDFNKVWRDGHDHFDGINVIKLEILLRQKIDAVVNCMRDGEACRPKDLADIKLITTWIEEHGDQHRVR